MKFLFFKLQLKRTYTDKWIDGASSKAVGYGDAPHIKSKMNKNKGTCCVPGRTPWLWPSASSTSAASRRPARLRHGFSLPSQVSWVLKRAVDTFILWLWQTDRGRKR